MLARSQVFTTALLLFPPFALAQETSSSTATLPKIQVTEEEAPPPPAYSGETTLGKTGQSLREMPQSISIITRARLEDQNISALPEALKFATGVTVQRFDGAGLFNAFHARGFTADSFLIDGQIIRINTNMADLDLAPFERIEVLRGPAGLFQGAGQPGLTVNLVRKRALAPSQVQVALGAGSWDNYRGEIDATGALTDSGRIRGRVVTVYEDRDSYARGVGAEKKLVYGTMEFDVTESGTISVGGTYQDADATTDQGLPAFPDGRLLDVSRSTAIIADWNLQDMKTAESFAEFENRFDSGQLFKIALRRHDRDSFYKSARANSAVRPDGSIQIQYVDNISYQTDTTGDMFFSTPFSLAGRTHTLLIGGDYRDGDTFSTHSDGLPTQSNVFNHNQNIPEPVLVEALAQRTRADTEEYGVYSQLRLKPVDRFTVLLGGRVSWWESTDRSDVTGLVTLRSEEKSEFTPYAGAIFDLNRTLSWYVNYTDIFKPQTERTFQGEQLQPRTGVQYETGIKGEFLDGQLNAHAAIFRINDENRALGDPDNPGFSIAIGEVQTEGFETEVSGQLSSQWGIGAGYSYTSTEYIKAAVNQQGQPFSTFTPKHSANLWTHYVLADGAIPGLELGAGLRAVSDFYAQSGAVRLEADSFTTVSTQVGYTFKERYKLALNVDNLFDEKYYEKVSGVGRQNFYGAPRSVMLTMRTKF